MEDGLAMFQASVHSVRTVPSRKVVQVVVEAPIEQHAAIAQIASHDSWVCVAQLKQNTEIQIPKARKQWNELPPASQAAIRCGEEAFWEFLNVASKEEAEIEVRKRCEVQSRTEFSTSEKAAAAWETLDADYQMYQRGGR